MSKNIITIILILFLSAILSAETTITPLPDLMNPENLFFDDTQMYVIEGTSIYIYSLKDFKLVKKFGKSGAGPKEFLLNSQSGQLFVDPQNELLHITTGSKLSFFTKQGEFVSEMKPNTVSTMAIQKFGKGYLAASIGREGESLHLRLITYNDKMQAEQVISKIPYGYQPQKGFHVLRNNPQREVYKNTLYFAWKLDLVVVALDPNLKEIFRTKVDVPKIKVTEEYKNVIINHLKTSPGTKDNFHLLKPITFPEYFPAIYNLEVDGDLLYINTWKREIINDKMTYIEFVVFDRYNGKHLRSVMVPVVMSSPWAPYPSRIHNGYNYQLVEDIDAEEWSLEKTLIPVKE